MTTKAKRNDNGTVGQEVGCASHWNSGMGGGIVFGMFGYGIWDMCNWWHCTIAYEVWKTAWVGIFNIDFSAQFTSVLLSHF